VPPRTPAKQTTTADIGSFETEFERLGSIVSRLESGNIALEEMLKLYEEGMTLASKLTTTLETAELRVEKLSRTHVEDSEQTRTMTEEESLETFLLE
jgi:exodeoxyribonuclease VII small subunit